MRFLSDFLVSLLGYGMTELTCASHGLGSREKNKVGSIGRLLPNMECKVIYPGTGKILGPNQDGEICIKGPIVMKGSAGGA